MRRTGAFAAQACAAMSRKVEAAMDEQAMMDDQSIADAILADAERYAATKGYRLGEGAEHHFRHSAESGARLILQSPPDSNARREKMTQAQHNFHAMIDAMIEARSEAYAGDPERLGGNIIGEVTLGMAHNKLCPIWPFC
jgi:hypothetical protein